MKTNLIIVAILALFLISCQKTPIEPVTETEQKQEITAEIVHEVEEERKTNAEEEVNKDLTETKEINETHKDLTQEEQEIYEGLKEECEYSEEQTAHYVFALKNSDEEFCNKIEDQNQKELCKAEIKKDTKICENSANEKICEAIISKNNELCEKEDHYCLGLTTKDTKQCEQIEDPAIMEDCFLYIELKTEEFSMEKIKQRCKDSAYLFMATEQYRDEKFCTDIMDLEVKKICIEMSKRE